ncbi:MAG: hypothetical protein RIS09_988 [Actinomycetota bacterium]|jgi:hypothetical protein
MGAFFDIFFESLVWLVLPVIVTLVAYFILRKRENTRPHSTLETGVKEMKQYISILGEKKPHE